MCLPSESLRGLSWLFCCFLSNDYLNWTCFQLLPPPSLFLDAVISRRTSAAWTLCSNPGGGSNKIKEPNRIILFCYFFIRSTQVYFRFFFWFLGPRQKLTKQLISYIVTVNTVKGPVGRNPFVFFFVPCRIHFLFN